VLEITPQVLVITNLEWDHTDYFSSLEALQETFRKAVARLPKEGTVIANPNDSNVQPVLAGALCRIIDYTLEPGFTLTLPGEFNQMNARAAVAAARAITPNFTIELAAAALASFSGTWRRFEYKGKTKGGADVYDDYAHHPTAITKTLAALRQKTQGKIIVAFHPHLYSRTRDLLEEFSRAFKDADSVYIAPIYAAREKDDGTISNTILAERIRERGGQATGASFEEIEEALEKAGPGDTVMTMGAGDIYKVADKLVTH
jgi:UDP-N-acetylmuramate--alanine ligase